MPATDACDNYVPNDLASGGPCNGCQKCCATRDEHANTRRTYRVGDLLTLKSGAQWRVRKQFDAGNGRDGVALVDPSDPNHGTSFYADVLDTLVVAESARPTYPESGDYPVGDYTVSTRVVLDDESVVIVSGTGGRQLLQATPAEARALSTALRVAADQADADAGTDPTADDTPDWLLQLAAVSSVPRRWVVTADADGKFTIPKAGVWEFSTAPAEQTSIAPSFGLLAGDERVFGNPYADDTARCREWLGLDDK